MSEKKKILFYMGHPAHFHLFKNLIRMLKENGHSVAILIKTKDVLEQLLQSAGWEYVNINPKGRKDNKLSIAFALLNRDIKTIRYCLRFRPDMMFGTSAEITHAGKLLGIRSVVVNEDDADVVPLFAKTAYPFAWKILAPECCRTGKWEKKKISYHGYHELAYLHPDYFKPDEQIGKQLKGNNERYFILRFAHLGAHHDAGRKGINAEVTHKLLEILLPAGKVYITSERQLEPEFEPYRISIPPEMMHHALYYADMYIGDSQTMTAEAAVLGTPSFRFNDFVGQISYLEELEKKYQLTRGFKSDNVKGLIEAVQNQLLMPENQILNQRKKAARLYAESDDLNRICLMLINNSN